MRLPIRIALALGLLTSSLPVFAQAQGRRPVRAGRAATVRVDPDAAARREVERASTRAARARATVSRTHDRGAHDMLRRADDLVSRARRSLARGRARQARDQAYSAQRLLSRAEDAGRRSHGSGAQVQTQLGQLERRISMATRAARHTKSPRARQLLRTARDNRREAASALRAGDNRTARRYLRAGNRAALEVVERWGR